MAARSGLEGYAYAAMRIVTGLLFLFHGLQKVLGMHGGQVQAVGSLPWVAGVIELTGGILVMVGLFTALTAFICSGEMAAAYFMAHFPEGFWPIENQASWRHSTASCSSTSPRAAAVRSAWSGLERKDKSAAIRARDPP